MQRLLGSYWFQLGDFHCACLLDGYVDYQVEDVYAWMPEEKPQKSLRQYDPLVDIVTTPYTYLFVNTGKNRVLVDIGAGGWIPGTGRIIQTMRAARIRPRDIDSVFITHAHPDHVGGMLNKRGKPNFSHARYYMSKDEWDFWFSESAVKSTTERYVLTARLNLEPVKERMVMVEGEIEVLPGIWVIPAPGHTPGCLVVSINSGEEKLFYIGDTVLQSFQPEYSTWVSILDVSPDQALESRQRILNRAADENCLVVSQRFFPFPSLGRVSRDAGGWCWNPVLRRG